MDTHFLCKWCKVYEKEKHNVNIYKKNTFNFTYNTCKESSMTAVYQ